jgi:hypothetical protein
MKSTLLQLVLSSACTPWRWHFDAETCRCKVTIVISCTVCVFSWYIKWREAWNVNEWFTAAWGVFSTSRNENPFGKMSRWNSFLTLSKLSLYPLPIPDDGGSNCCRNVLNVLHFALVFFWKNFVTLTWHFVSTPHVYLRMLSRSQIT